MERLGKEARTVVVWTKSDGAVLERVTDAVRQRTSAPPAVEHVEKLAADVCWECVVCADAGCVSEAGRILKALQPGGVLLLWQCDDVQASRSALTLHGFINIESDGMHLVATKPPFEVGAKRSLRAKEDNGAWGAAGAGDEELVEDEGLLGAEDLARPSPAELRVCGTTGQRKACADCTCGLAAELSQEEDSAKQQQPTSSCGSCYLGDAFRCSSCPYRGLPAFRPGERVLLQDLAPDL